MREKLIHLLATAGLVAICLSSCSRATSDPCKKLSPDNLAGIGFAITEKNSVTLNEDGCRIDIIFRGRLQNRVLSAVEGDSRFGPIKPIEFDLDGYIFRSKEPQDNDRTFFEVEAIKSLKVSSDEKAIDTMAKDIFGTVEGIRLGN